MSNDLNIEERFKEKKLQMLRSMNRFRKADKEFSKAKEGINENLDAFKYSLKETVNKNQEFVSVLDSLRKVTLELSSLGKK